MTAKPRNPQTAPPDFRAFKHRQTSAPDAVAAQRCP